MPKILGCNTKKQLFSTNRYLATNPICCFVNSLKTVYSPTITRLQLAIAFQEKTNYHSCQTAIVGRLDKGPLPECRGLLLSKPTEGNSLIKCSSRSAFFVDILQDIYRLNRLFIIGKTWIIDFRYAILPQPNSLEFSIARN